MDKKLIISIALFLVFGFTSLAVGALTTDNQDYIQFYGDANNHYSDANIGTISDFNAFTQFEALQHKIADKVRNDYNSREFTMTTVSTSWNPLIELQIKTDNSYINSADKIGSIVENLPVFSNHFSFLNIYWTKLSSSPVKIDIINNNNSTDDFLPVTMPSVSWFLGTGLIGLVGVSRRWMV